MKRNMLGAVFILAANATAGAALADNGYATGHHALPDRGNATHQSGTMMSHFNHLDQNKDGQVSREEMATHEDMATQEDMRSMTGQMPEDFTGPNS